MLLFAGALQVSFVKVPGGNAGVAGSGRWSQEESGCSAPAVSSTLLKDSGWRHLCTLLNDTTVEGPQTGTHCCSLAYAYGGTSSSLWYVSLPWVKCSKALLLATRKP